MWGCSDRVSHTLRTVFADLQGRVPPARTDSCLTMNTYSGQPQCAFQPSIAVSHILLTLAKSILYGQDATIHLDQPSRTCNSRRITCRTPVVSVRLTVRQHGGTRLDILDLAANMLLDMTATLRSYIFNFAQALLGLIRIRVTRLSRHWTLFLFENFSESSSFP